jgi:phosphatidylglycerol---prolipoprotein diacylglyceryl transferase
MWPTFYQIDSASGSMGLHSYGLLILLAFSAAFLMVHSRAQQVGFHPDRLLPVYIAAAFGGLLGARLLYLIAVAKSFAPSAVFAGGGFVYYGGVLGGAVAILFVTRQLGLASWKFLDVVAPALLIGLGIGRFGCFFAGCCHGAIAPEVAERTALLGEGVLHGQLWLQSSFPFLTLEFHDGVGRLLHQPLYPTQVWSAIIGLGLALGLHSAWSKRRFDGQLAAISLILEPLGRIFVEMFRADHRGYAVQWTAPGWIAEALPGMSRAGNQLGDAAVIGLTTSQAIGAGMALCGVGILIFRRAEGVSEEQPIDDDDDDDDDDY